MKSKTIQNDPGHRGDEGHFELKKLIISTWLERRGVVKTFKVETVELENEIQEIQALLNKSEDRE